MSDTTSFQSNSSNIQSVSFEAREDQDLGELRVAFRSGATYAYADVPVEVFEMMKAIEEQTGSCNSHFNKTVKNVYAYERISG